MNKLGVTSLHFDRSFQAFELSEEELAVRDTIFVDITKVFNEKVCYIVHHRPLYVMQLCDWGL